mmetsp:Transcript_120538/g.236930  ORF Transcript_120538/g.236930 Transcript_120538/m.236930 type:complete len:246 (-) Transcript_120538:29-766(-)|eukprot:CAMPEP_0170235484 /NCGR_PEP_ID=MMETSP0116_2-20130129/17488_1 /TAXON_ID=400756 /ORGANISM="Durinskia baltica, Strain CSIRO CS-38" /LENGTH=245 /DNA_ID=CAMNT_0010486279 /DNA_START=133 /DNA_END=873 /DNA_ORIENTATION=+
MAENQAEYLVTMQPVEGSLFAQSLLLKRAECRRAGLGNDSTGLYPPHVSVTGFFKATEQQVNQLLSIVGAEFADAIRRARAGHISLEDGQFVKVKQLLTTNGGHVILDIAAPAMSDFAASLAAKAARIGAHVRPKAVRHMSIAAGRHDQELHEIAKIHQDLDMGECGWNLVVSRLLYRSDVESLQRDGKTHEFCDVLRLPIPRTSDVGWEAIYEPSNQDEYIVPPWKELHQTPFAHGEGQAVYAD